MEKAQVGFCFAKIAKQGEQYGQFQPVAFLVQVDLGFFQAGQSIRGRPAPVVQVQVDDGEADWPGVPCGFEAVAPKVGLLEQQVDGFVVFGPPRPQCQGAHQVDFVGIALRNIRHHLGGVDQRLFGLLCIAF